MSLSRHLARPMLASIFIAGPVLTLKNGDWAAGQAAKVTDKLTPALRKIGGSLGVTLPEKPETWVKINAGVQLAAGLALATGRAPRLSSAVLAATLVPTTYAGHPFWEEQDPQARNAQITQLAKNLSLLGGLVIAAGDTDGKPGVFWRTKHAASDLRRTAQLEAKVLKAKAPLS